MKNKSKKSSFLQSIITASIDLEEDNLTLRSKFNFSYFCVQDAGQDFCDWNGAQLSKLLNKLKEYSKQPLTYWEGLRIGAKDQRVLSVYGNFPINSDFKHPPHVPHQALWARFRLEQGIRLIGFIIPREKHHSKHHCGGTFDCNTFYVVFLDENHVFYKMAK